MWCSECEREVKHLTKNRRVCTPCSDAIEEREWAAYEAEKREQAAAKRAKAAKEAEEWEAFYAQKAEARRAKEAKQAAEWEAFYAEKAAESKPERRTLESHLLSAALRELARR